MAEIAAAELAPHQPPARFEIELVKSAGRPACPCHHHLGPCPWLGGQGDQQGVRSLTAHQQPIGTGQVTGAHPYGVAVGIDIATADAGEVKGGQQGIDGRWLACPNGETGLAVVELFVDVQLIAAAAANGRGHQHEPLGIEFGRREHRLGNGSLGRQGCRDSHCAGSDCTGSHSTGSHSTSSSDAAANRQ